VPPTKKPKVFEHLFHWRYDPATMEKSPRFDEATGTIPEDRRLVYSFEVAEANREIKAGLGANIDANFAKDFLRKKSRNTNWPESLRNARWFVKQVTRKDPATNLARHMRFAPYADDQVEPFPDEWPIPPDCDTHSIQSVTLSIASKQIARLDEPRLMQIAVDLRIVETHFALYSPLSKPGHSIVHMDHLQMGVKLSGSEIDGLYIAEFADDDGGIHPALITVEAKKHDEYVNTTQIIAQIEKATSLGVKAEYVIPIAIKHGDGGLFVFEFKPYETHGEEFEDDSIDPESLTRTAAVFYAVKPEILSFGLRKRRTKRAPKVKAGEKRLDLPAIRPPTVAEAARQDVDDVDDEDDEDEE
jgi:hypothetical protein